MKRASITVGLMGDVMLGRLVNEQIERTSYSYPWGDVLPLLKNLDLRIMNLETTLTTSTKAVPKIFNYKADPDKVQTLQKVRIDAVNLANNHILDFSVEGLVKTITVLDKAGIKHVGAGKNKKEARKPAVIIKKNIKIGILGCTDNEPGWGAGDKKPGTNYIEIGNQRKVNELIEDIKKLQQKVDILVLTIHWGPNMKQRPSKEFQDFAHKVIDAGVDIFHGHSAHVFQGIEIYKKKVIFYDTGDFIDDYAVDPILRNDQSFLFLVKVSKKGIKKIELISVLISDMQVNKAKEEDYKGTIERMKELSREFGTRFKETAPGIVLAEP